MGKKLSFNSEWATRHSCPHMSSPHFCHADSNKIQSFCCSTVTFRADAFKDISPTPLSLTNLFSYFHKNDPGKGSGSGLFVPKQIPGIPEWDLKGEACFLLFPVSLLRQVKMAPSYFSLSSSSDTVAFPPAPTSPVGFQPHGYVDFKKSSIRLTTVSQCPLDSSASRERSGKRIVKKKKSQAAKGGDRLVGTSSTQCFSHQ